MKFGKQTIDSTVRFCRIKRRGRKNCRVIWLDTNEEQLLSVAAFAFCSEMDAGVAPTVTSATDQAVPSTLTGEAVCALMRSYQVTTKELAARLGVSTATVRDARATGLADQETIRLWQEAIETQPEVTTV